MRNEGLVAQSCLTLCDPMDCRPPGSSVHGIFRQEYGSGLPFPSPEDLPDPGIECISPALQADSSPSEPPGKLKIMANVIYDVLLFIYFFFCYCG